MCAGPRQADGQLQGFRRVRPKEEMEGGRAQDAEADGEAETVDQACSDRLPAAGARPERPLPAGRPRPTAPSQPALRPTRLPAPRHGGCAGSTFDRPHPVTQALHRPPPLGPGRRRIAGGQADTQGGAVGSRRRTPRPPPSLLALSPSSSMPAAFSASTTLISVSMTPRTLPWLASIRWMVGSDTPAMPASVCWSMPRSARAARNCAAVIIVVCSGRTRTVLVSVVKSRCLTHHSWGMGGCQTLRV